MHPGGGGGTVLACDRALTIKMAKRRTHITNGLFKVSSSSSSSSHPSLPPAPISSLFILTTVILIVISPNWGQVIQSCHGLCNP